MEEIKKQFKVLKKRHVEKFYEHFVNDLKCENPGKWYQQLKRISFNEQGNGDLVIDCLKDLSNQEAAEEIANHFSKISQEYDPLDVSKLPAYLPAPEMIKVSEKEVAEKLWKLKNRKSTLPIDLPSKLRKLFPWELSVPLTHIINTCLANHHYPDAWKQELVVPVEKVPNPSQLKDLRKIALTSEFSLIFEGFMKDWILHDVQPKIDRSQFGNQKGSSTEHLLVCLMDQVLGLLDKNKGAAVIASMVDWASAFDRQDPTLAIEKFLSIGVRPSLIPILVSYLSGRKMKVRFNGTYSTNHSLPGGGAQGTLLGVLQYLIQSNDNANCVEESMRYKFVDDLTILELVLLSHWLSEYNFKQHVASDIGIEELFISSENLSTQFFLNEISRWTEENRMQLNEKKSNYMLFTRSNTEVSTRLEMNGQTIDRVEETKLLGVWLSTYLDWTKNTKEMCKKSYARMTMLTKLKYVGVPESDLLEIYILYIRSLLEYCSTVWHSTLQLNKMMILREFSSCVLR